jgi:DNA gyrase inhibitor GyrI
MKTNILTLLAAGGILLTSLAVTAAAAGRDKYESPSYKVVKNDGAYEVRDYPSVVVASASMAANDGKRNSAFMSLFRYISGQNEAAQKIEMTSPVFTDTEGKKPSMSFVVPAAVAKAGAPKANNPDIAITKRKAGRFAVYRYSGRWTTKKEAAARAKLMAWISGEGLTATGTVEKANYDPPFTLPAFRRNEVLVRVRE